MNATEPVIQPDAVLRTGLARPISEAERDARRSRRVRMHRLRQVLLGLVILAAATLTVNALRPRALPVDAATVKRGPLAVVIEETGTTRVKDRYVVSAPVTGELSRVALDPGDAVAEGDALIEITPASPALLDSRSRQTAEARVSAAMQALGQARAQQARAAAAKQLSEQQLARDRTLANAGSLMPQVLEESEFTDRIRGEELASATFATKVAAEEVRGARAALGQGEGPTKRHIDVLAPVSGAVLRVLQKSAQLVPAGTPLLELGDPRALEVVVDLLTTDAVHIHPGTPVTLQGWGGDHTLAGRVHRVEPSAFTRLSALGVEEQRVNVIIILTEPQASWATLGDGFRIEARLILWQGDDVLHVPQGAVFRHGNGFAVFDVSENVARLVPVEVGHRGESDVEITRGLEAGAHVAVHPGDRIKDGVKVEPR